MAFEKRYTAKEAALAVLKKTEEMLKSAGMDKHGLSPAQIKSKLSKEEMDKSGLSPAQIKAKMGKAENPDEKEDAQLGEDVEHLCEDHMLANKDAERKEGHKIVQKSECMKCNWKKPTPATGQGTTLPASKAHDAWEMDKSELYGDLEKLEELFKAETKHDRCVEHVKENSPEVKNPHAVCVAEGVRPSKWGKSEDRDKKGGVDVGKEKVGYKPSKLGEEEKDQEMPSDSAFEVKGKDSKSSDDKRQASQPSPESNPKEEAEGNNAEPGSKPGVESKPGQDTPPIKGHLKLAKFVGRMELKRSQKGSM